MTKNIVKKLRAKLFFAVEDVADFCGIKPASARVLCSRYVKRGMFIRLKNNFYVLDEKWDIFSREDFFSLANYLQVPSYISFMTALSAYDITTQTQGLFFESASIKRTRKFDVQGAIFNYYKLKKELYFDFIKSGNFFIATKEKAFVDSAYLYSFGKYKFDLTSIDVGKFDKKKIARIICKYPVKTRLLVERICKTS